MSEEIDLEKHHKNQQAYQELMVYLPYVEQKYQEAKSQEEKQEWSRRYAVAYSTLEFLDQELRDLLGVPEWAPYCEKEKV